MAEKEQDEFELEIEIVDLDRRSAGKDPGDRFTLRRPRLTERQRRLSLWFTALLFVVVIGILLGSTSAVRNLLAQTWLKPAPTAVPASVHFYLQGNPTWGRFTLDGQILTSLPLPVRDLPLSLSPGRHQIMWQAAPFNARTCLFTVINALNFSSPCLDQQLIRSQDAAVLPGHQAADAQPALLFTFFASLKDLAAGERTPLVQQIQHVLTGYSGSETLLPGEVYAVSVAASEANPALCQSDRRFALCFARADQPLSATLTLQLDVNAAPGDPCVAAGQCALNGTDCRQFCNPIDGNAALPAGWSVNAMVRLFWSYQTSAGQVMASEQPDSAIRGTVGYQTVTLRLTRERQAWQAALSDPTSDPSCAQAAQDTQELYNAATSGLLLNYASVSADIQGQTAKGCLILIDPLSAPGATPTATLAGSSSPVARGPLYYLFRCGVVLAVNDAAHQALPEIPVADAYEQTVAQTLLLHLPA